VSLELAKFPEGLFKECQVNCQLKKEPYLTFFSALYIEGRDCERSGPIRATESGH